MTDFVRDPDLCVITCAVTGVLALAATHERGNG